jgi:uncharacterized protein YndB with AHSA1/START domain
MGTDECPPVAVSRRIEAPAERIFAVLTDPQRHPELDGSGMLQPGAPSATVVGIGDVFVMKMKHPKIGDYEMDNYVVSYERDRRIGWEPWMHGEPRDADSPHRNGSRWMFELASDGPDVTVVTETDDCAGSPDQVREAVANGTAWVGAMTATLEQLDKLCAPSSG